jgi:hypothetical protein
MNKYKRSLQEFLNYKVPLDNEEEKFDEFGNLSSPNKRDKVKNKRNKMDESKNKTPKVEDGVTKLWHNKSGGNIKSYNNILDETKKSKFSDRISNRDNKSPPRNPVSSEE